MEVEVDDHVPQVTQQLLDYLDRDAYWLFSELNGVYNNLTKVLARVNELIDAGALLNSPDGVSPLYLVCSWRLKSWSLVPDQAVECMVQLLLDKGADPNVPSNGEMPIFPAVRCHLINVVKMFLRYGADVTNVWGSLGDGRVCTPLHMAAVRGDTEIFRVILQKVLANVGVGASASSALPPSADDLQALCNQFSHL